MSALLLSAAAASPPPTGAAAAGSPAKSAAKSAGQPSRDTTPDDADTGNLSAWSAAPAAPPPGTTDEGEETRVTLIELRWHRTAALWLD